MTEQAQVRLRKINGIPLVEVMGEVDAANIEGLQSVLSDAARDDRGVVIVSLARATYFDSRTVHALMDFGKRLRIGRQRLLLVAPQESSPRRILKIAGVGGLFPLYDSVDEAMASGADDAWG